MYAPSGLWLAAAIAVLTPAAASACDACLDSRIAATVDHSVNQRAAADGAIVVYCAISGPIDKALLSRNLRRLHGVQAQSLRIADPPSRFSFAVDARQQSPQAVVDAAHAGVAPGTRLRIVRVVTTLPATSGVRRASAP